MTQLTPIRGFVNTPVVKTTCIVLTILAVFVSIFQLKHLFRLSIDPFIVEYNQYWRLVTFQVSFVNESDYLLGIILLFQFKVLERFYGSRKFMSLLVVFGLYNAVVTFLVMSLGQLLINFVDFLVLKVVKIGGYKFFLTFLNSVCPGPIGVISTLYVCFGYYIPVSYEFQVVLRGGSQEGGQLGSQEGSQETEGQETGQERVEQERVEARTKESVESASKLVLTDHFQIHVIYTLLLLNNGFSSIIPGLVGLFIGKLFVSDLLPGSKGWLLPSFLFRLIVSPNKTIQRTWNSVGARFSGYQRVSTAEPPQDNEIDNDNDNDDREEIVDDIRNNNYNEIRAETPVRPLASQFLDTFRNTST